MPRMVKCVKLQKELPGLDYRPFNNELGQRIYDNVSQEAWKMWLEHFKMVMNEYRLAGGSEQANQVLFDQAEKFFFGEGAAPPLVIDRGAHGHAREPGVECPSAFQPQAGKRAFLDQSRPDILAEIGRIGPSRTDDLRVIPLEELRPGAAVSPHAALDQIAIAHRPIPPAREGGSSAR